MYYVVVDKDGPWISEDPDEGDEIVFQSNSLFEAEQVLCRECNNWEDEHPDMNADFRDDDDILE